MEAPTSSERQVKPDMLNEWVDLQKNEVNPILKKIGVKQRSVSRPVFGNTYEFVSLSPLEKYGVLDDVVAAFSSAAGSSEAAARLSEKNPEVHQRLTHLHRHAS